MNLSGHFEIDFGDPKTAGELETPKTTIQDLTNVRRGFADVDQCSDPNIQNDING